MRHDAAKLAERNCQVLQANSLEEAFAQDGPFDAVIFGTGFEELNDPIDALKGLAKLLAEAGVLIVVAENASHASVRVRALLGQTDVSGALPVRRYDLASLERVVVEAGLHVADALREIDPVAPETLDAVAPGLSELITGEDASTRRFVIVGSRAQIAGDTVAAALQRQVASLTAQVAELDALRAQLEAANTKVRDQEIELDARKDALVERIELIERLYAERRHLELEIVVKDDYISILRRDRNDWRNLHGHVQYELDDLRRSRHYKVAAGMHRALGKVPLLPSLARWAAKRVMAARGRGA